MLYRVDFSWKHVAQRSYKASILDAAIPFRTRKFEIVLQHSSHPRECFPDIREWLLDNSQRTDYSIFGIFSEDDRNCKFEGTSFIFRCPIIATTFKLQYA